MGLEVKGPLAHPLVLDADTEDALPVLIALLRDPNLDVRSAAAVALHGFGPRAKAAVPTLLELLNDDSEVVRWYAGMALKQIDPDAAARACEP